MEPTLTHRQYLITSSIKYGRISYSNYWRWEQPENETLFLNAVNQIAVSFTELGSIFFFFFCQLIVSSPAESRRASLQLFLASSRAHVIVSPPREREESGSIWSVVNGLEGSLTPTYDRKTFCRHFNCVVVEVTRQHQCGLVFMYVAIRFLVCSLGGC